MPLGQGWLWPGLTLSAINLLAVHLIVSSQAYMSSQHCLQADHLYLPACVGNQRAGGHAGLPACRTEKRERNREAKAEVAAKLESSIEAELLQRLKQGMYGDIYNIHQKVYEKVGQLGVSTSGQLGHHTAWVVQLCEVYILSCRPAAWMRLVCDEDTYKTSFWEPGARMPGAMPGWRPHDAACCGVLGACFELLAGWVMAAGLGSWTLLDLQPICCSCTHLRDGPSCLETMHLLH